MSLQFHPDKSDEPDAQARFIEIGGAYENEDVRKAYDDFLAHPERHLWEHYSNYYQAYYAPKSDVRLVILGIVSLLSILQYSIAYSRRSRLIEMILSQSKTQVEYLPEPDTLIMFDFSSGFCQKPNAGTGIWKFESEKTSELSCYNIMQLNNSVMAAKDCAKYKEVEKQAELEVLERTVVNGVKLSEPFLDLQLWDQEKLEEWQQQQMVADEEKRREFMQVGSCTIVITASEEVMVSHTGTLILFHPGSPIGIRNSSDS
eukprot:755982-Hanusia_phi.AAC.3